MPSVSSNQDDVPPIVRRVRKFKRTLVLEVFLRRGPLWNHIHALREKWGIEPTTALPPDNRRSTWDIIVPRSISKDHQQEFADDLDRLHDLVIPGYLHDIYPPRSHLVWRFFLSICVLFDPPGDQLLEYSELATHHGRDLDPVSSRFMRWEHPLSARQGEEAYWTRVLTLLYEEYLHPKGIEKNDLNHALAVISHKHGDELRTLRGPEPPEEHRYYVVVDEFTRREDLDQVWSAIKDEFNIDMDNGNGRERDPLTAVQVAELRDRYGRSNADIAKHFGWSATKDGVEDTRVRSETVRSYAKLGRQIINQE